MTGDASDDLGRILPPPSPPTTPDPRTDEERDQWDKAKAQSAEDLERALAEGKLAPKALQALHHNRLVDKLERDLATCCDERAHLSRQLADLKPRFASLQQYLSDFSLIGWVATAAIVLGSLLVSSAGYCQADWSKYACLGLGWALIVLALVQQALALCRGPQK